jgi:hypothetical protein
MKIAVFWVAAPCSLAEVYQRFRGPCCLHHQGDDYTVLQPRRQQSSLLKNILTVFWNRNKKNWIDPNYPHAFWDSLVNFVFGYLIDGVVHFPNADEAIGVTSYNQPIFRKILSFDKGIAFIA